MLSFNPSFSRRPVPQFGAAAVNDTASDTLRTLQELIRRSDNGWVTVTGRPGKISVSKIATGYAVYYMEPNGTTARSMSFDSFGNLSRATTGEARMSAPDKRGHYNKEGIPSHRWGISAGDALATLQGFLN